MPPPIKSSSFFTLSPSKDSIITKCNQALPQGQQQQRGILTGTQNVLMRNEIA